MGRADETRALADRLEGEEAAQLRKELYEYARQYDQIADCVRRRAAAQAVAIARH